MATEVKAPNLWQKDSRFTIFLAGSIDQGSSWDWQKHFVEAMANEDVILLNPRRTDWSKDWTGTLDNPNFVHQVRWEQQNLQKADYRIFVLLSESLSPITLLELGQYMTQPGAVYCDPGFYRRANVSITAALFGMPVFDSIDRLITHTKMMISQRNEPHE